MNGVAVFEFFVRVLPRERNFLVAAGLDQVLDYLDDLGFSKEERAWMRNSGRFTPEFIDSLADLHFTGDVDAVPEGTVFFANEPILRITAPLREAQLIESRVMNLLHYETLVASKAARMVLAALGKKLVDFGLRRAHGAEAGLLSARASYLAGFAGTATVEAGRRFRLPIYGTMAHSYVLAHADETAGFESFAKSQPANAIFLLDTYDTEKATRKVVALAPKLAKQGIAVSGVRIDSGDLGEQSRRVRSILDASGLVDTMISASGNLDEYKLRELVAQDAPIDGFGVGTRMNTSADAPYLDCAYKLQEYDGRPRRKRSQGKATWPGRKQVYREQDCDGVLRRDLLTLDGVAADRTPLLRPIARGGVILGSRTTLDSAREHAAAELARLPGRLRSLNVAAPYRVTVSSTLRWLAAEVDATT